MDVIFSTNYAGRGTDIKTNAELEANGGLHVIVTFMPNNSRDRQAFGGTARQGKKGTAQFILNELEIVEDLFTQNMDILAKRDQLIEQSFEESKNEVLPKLLVKERLFTKFSTFIGEMRESTANAVGGNEQILAQIEEHWGFWLREKVEMRDADAPMPSEAVLVSELDAFIMDERRKANNLSIFTNPSYLVLKGCKLDYGNAIAHLEKAIELDAHRSGFAAPAHYYMALALVKKGWIKPDPDNKLPQREVHEFGKFGVKEFYQLEYANPPKAWASIWGMYFLGAVQFGIGCLFALTGNFGLAVPFLQCGIRDLFEAAKAHIQNTVISWSKNIIDKILTYGPVFARLASSCLSTCKNGIGKFLYECANRLGLANPLATSTVGMGAFVTKVIVSSCTAELKHNCWRDLFKGYINRGIAVVARKVFGDGDGFMKNLAEAVCVRLVTNKFEEKFDKIADKCYDDAIKKIKKVLNDPLPSSSTDKRAELLARLRKLNLGREHDDYLEGLAWRVSRNSPNNCGDAGPPYDDGGFGPPDGSGGPGPPYDGGGPGPPYDGGGSGPPDGSGGPGPPYDGGGPGPPDDGGDAGPPVLLLTAKKPDDGGDAGPPVLLLTAPKPKPKKYALDCECVGIGPDGKDSMLARGMGPGEVDHPLLSFAEAQIEVKKLIPGNFLIGHQLDKDLKYLKMDHPAELTRDTAKAKFLRKRLGDEKNTPSLDKIYHQEFGVHMYKPGQEHDSVWDAKCPLRVYLKNEEEWEKEIRDEKKESLDVVLTNQSSGCKECLCWRGCPRVHSPEASLPIGTLPFSSET
uniref:SECA_MOTOR_DEAD domain-containing protein n=1 Tax=Globodera pallida TaxID=36090 RepID=A0A183C6F5_GLOPA